LKKSIVSNGHINYRQHFIVSSKPMPTDQSRENIYDSRVISYDSRVILVSFYDSRTGVSTNPETPGRAPWTPR
jgi:hypothetical protein